MSSIALIVAVSAAFSRSQKRDQAVRERSVTGSFDQCFGSARSGEQEENAHNARNVATRDQTHMPEVMLALTDRIAMCYSLELRVPLVGQGLAECCGVAGLAPASAWVEDVLP